MEQMEQSLRESRDEVSWLEERCGEAIGDSADLSMRVDELELASQRLRLRRDRRYVPYSRSRAGIFAQVGTRSGGSPSTTSRMSVCTRSTNSPWASSDDSYETCPEVVEVEAPRRRSGPVEEWRVLVEEDSEGNPREVIEILD